MENAVKLVGAAKYLPKVSNQLFVQSLSLINIEKSEQINSAYLKEIEKKIKTCFIAYCGLNLRVNYLKHLVRAQSILLKLEFNEFKKLIIPNLQVAHLSKRRSL